MVTHFDGRAPFVVMAVTSESSSSLLSLSFFTRDSEVNKKAQSNTHHSTQHFTDGSFSELLRFPALTVAHQRVDNACTRLYARRVCPGRLRARGLQRWSHGAQRTHAHRSEVGNLLNLSWRGSARHLQWQGHLREERSVLAQPRLRHHFSENNLTGQNSQRTT